MNILKILLLFNKKPENIKDLNLVLVDQYEQIAKLVKEARIQQNLSIQELSNISKIPVQTINSLENNIENNRPKYPFIRSILIKLEECLFLKKNTLVKFTTREIETLKKEKKDILFSKFDLLNSWQGTVLYFFILIFSLFILKRYFMVNVNVIEIKNIENKIIDN